MRIGIYASSIAVRPGYEHIVSGHVQVPLHTARLLLDAGHEVHLITTGFDQDMVLPAITPRDLVIHQLPHYHLEQTEAGSRSVIGTTGRVRSSLMASLGLMRLARYHRYDVLHFFGASGTASLAGLVRLLRSSCPVVVTLNVGRFPGSYFRFTRFLWNRIDHVITTTNYFRKALRHQGIQADTVRHGILRRFDRRSLNPPPRSRVLFWREASPLNGGDIGAEVFGRLAPRHPDITFDFAVRPHRHQPEEVADLARRLPNVNLYTTPYPQGITLDTLLNEAICVLQPFRAFTIQPQFSILESMSAGVPVVATDIQSASELIENGVDGLLVPPEDPAAAACAVESLLNDPEAAAAMGHKAMESSMSKWHWDGYASELLTRYRSVLGEGRHIKSS